MTRFSIAPLWRRLVATAFDSVPGLVLALFTASLTAELPYVAPSGWFWSEWLLKIWLDAPVQLLAPLGVAVVGTVVWIAGWEATSARSPGARLMGFEVVDRRGRPVGWVNAVGRGAGMLINVATVGFGFFWAWIDPEGRGLHDRLGGAWVVLRREG